jgi:hypothetical protein
LLSKLQELVCTILVTNWNSPWLILDLRRLENLESPMMTHWRRRCNGGYCLFEWKTLWYRKAQKPFWDTGKYSNEIFMYSRHITMDFFLCLYHIVVMMLSRPSVLVRPALKGDMARQEIRVIWAFY